MKISKKFRERLLLSITPQYRLALSVGIHPNTLSKMVHGAVNVRQEDKRVLRLGHILGLKKDEIYESTN